MILYLPAANIPFIYIIRCTPPQHGRTIFAYIGVFTLAVVYAYISADVGRLSLLILMKGQCEGLAEGIGADGAFSHVFFVSIRFVDSLCRGCHQPSYISHHPSIPVLGEALAGTAMCACASLNPVKEILNIYKLTLFTLLIKNINV